MNNLKWVFFGTDEFAVTVLETLARQGLSPSLIVTTPDKPKGRHLTLTPPPVKLWAAAHNIVYVQPASLRQYFDLAEQEWDLFVVASYGKIIPKHILDLPKHQALNIHPSLLPRHRGPSPLETTLLEGDEKTGVTIMLMDEEVDHGPIVGVETLPRSLDNIYYLELRDALAKLGGELLVRLIPLWTGGKIEAKSQDHTEATFTRKFTKEDGLIDLSGDPIVNYRKIRALSHKPGTYFFIQSRGANFHGLGIVSEDLKIGTSAHQTRIKITKAHLDEGRLVLDRVIPEGRKEMNWADFERNLN